MKVRCSGDVPKSGSSTTEASSSRDDSVSVTASQAAISPRKQRPSIASSSQSIPFDSIEEVSPFIPDEAIISLVNQYFERLYPLSAFCFLHQATVIQRCHDKTIDRALQLAICSITAIYFDQCQGERDAWAGEAEQLILDRLEQPSIFKIQASLLLIRYRAAVGQFPRAFIMAGLAARWAAAIRLNYEHSKLSPVAQEVRRRTFWSLSLLEDSFCVGLKEFELFDADTIYLQLPCEDADFQQERHVPTGYLQPGKGLEPEVLRIRAAFVRVAFIRRAIHMSWHLTHCDLYRIFLTGYPESTPDTMIEGISAAEKGLMKDKCLSHAEQIVKVLSDFVQHKEENEILEFEAAICTYHAARLVLFGTYTGKDNTGLPMQMAINKAQLCLDVITRYFAFSEQLKSMRQELERVIQQHKAWLESSDHRAITTTTDPNPAQSSKLAKDAYIRQRLAIHSLLRQSDFVDDSHDAAPAAPPEPESEQQSPEQQANWGIRDPVTDQNLMFGLPYGGGLDLNAWASSMAGNQDLNGLFTDFDEQYMY
ncbi:hypothetical protein NW769_003417 [Fusarium oxysporum]|nr:hypothetical protein NW769_003417 [Fusarium oxysporum]